MKSGKRRAHFCALLLLPFAFCLLPSCGVRRTPDLDRIFAAAREQEGKRPVIVIPGILGSQLVNRRTGEVAWPSAFRSDTDGLALPLSPDLEANRDDLIAERIVDTARFARLAPEVYIYHELLDALRRYGGYREGDWNNPPPDGDRDTFYVFAYDWRRDNVESARTLVRRIEELKQRLGRPGLRFNIVAHSMGGLVARYAAMYGDAGLPPAGQAPLPDWAGAGGINKIFMFGTPNEGSAEALTTLLEGYSVTEGLRRRVALLNQLTREDAITSPAVFQLLPHAGAARFLDENLQPLPVDLYDPETWRRYEWSALNDPRYRERLTQASANDAGQPRAPLSLADLDAYLAAVLQRARRFHEALNAASVTAAPVALFAFGSDCEETLAAPVILRDARRNRWLTLTAPREFRTASSRRVTRREATRAMYEPGDGRVTRRSLLGATTGGQRASALYDTPLPLAYAVFSCGLHSDLQNNPTLQNNALTLLLNELPK